MEKIIDYNLDLSFREIALRKVAVSLWNQKEILSSFDQFDIEFKVKCNISKLGLPLMLTKEMEHLVEPIESEIKNWKIFHENYLGIGELNIFNFIRHLCWTNSGTIDYQKTAENLIHWKALDNIQLYRLACLYCLDEHIPIFWKNLRKKDKKRFLIDIGDYETELVPLECCWPYILKGEETKLDFLTISPFGNRTSFIQYVFECSACSGNKAAVKYFLRKMPSDVREDSVFKIVEEIPERWDELDFDYNNFPEEKMSDTFCYLTSLLKPEQQMEVFRQRPHKALSCLLFWPWHHIFWDSAKLVWDYFDSKSFCFLLQCISLMKSEFYRRKLFREFFLRGSNEFIAEFVKDTCLGNNTLYYLLNPEDSGNVQIIFRKLGSKDKKDLLFSWHVFKFFYRSIMRNRLLLVELCFRETSLSKEELSELKVMYSEFLQSNLLKEDSNVKQHIWNQFMQLLNPAAN